MTHPLDAALKNADIGYVSDAAEWIIWCGGEEHAQAILNAARTLRNLQRLEAEGKIRVIEVDAEISDEMRTAATNATTSGLGRAVPIFKNMIRAAAPSRFLREE